MTSSVEKAERERIHIEDFILQWFVHVLWVPVAVLFATKDGIADWFKYRPKWREFRG